MTKLLIFILMSWSFFSFSGGKSEYSCEPISEVDTQDYTFDVIPIKRGDQKEIGPTQSLDLSVYREKIVLLNIFSPTCGWCMADLLYHTHFQEKNWPEDQVIMVNLSYGPLVNKKSVEERLETTPEEVLHFVNRGWTETRYGSQMDLKSMDFYHIVHTQTGKTAFDSIKELTSKDNQALLFPRLAGTPYSVIIDEEGQIRFRGHFTMGKAHWTEKLNRHYGGFITSLVNQSCEAPPSL